MRNSTEPSTTIGWYLSLAGTSCTGRWDERMDNMGMGLTGRTLGVVGAGRIGKELLRMARTFDVKLLAADPYVNVVELSYIGARKVPLETLLKESDFVVAIPLLNDETRHLIGAREFALMKPGAILINAARGNLVDEAALVEALKSGRIAGAGFDVLSVEPPREGNPLLDLDLPNFIPRRMSPGRASRPAMRSPTSSSTTSRPSPPARRATT